MILFFPLSTNTNPSGRVCWLLVGGKRNLLAGRFYKTETRCGKRWSWRHQLICNSEREQSASSSIKNKRFPLPFLFFIRGLPRARVDFTPRSTPPLLPLPCLMVKTGTCYQREKKVANSCRGTTHTPYLRENLPLWLRFKWNNRKGGSTNWTAVSVSLLSRILSPFISSAHTIQKEKKK